MWRLKAALPSRSQPGSLSSWPGWWRARARAESTRVSDLTRVPSRSTQRGRSAVFSDGEAEVGKRDSILAWGVNLQRAGYLHEAVLPAGGQIPGNSRGPANVIIIYSESSERK